ncbi:hypothetical protein PGQ11_001382 [Apiospora arundinis]|uniref:Rhodopsin domain-containing protein n=1 Tax=Apiospora arundinis TaxID=335852 RepID=A0ABR2JMW0_9PEZI
MDVPPGVDLSQIPLAPNPSGDPPNFNGGPNLAPTILATGITFMTISLIFVIIRLATGWNHTKKIHLDDYCCLLGELAGMAYWFVLYELQVRYGTAKHSWDIPASIITPTVMKGQSAAQVLTSIANPLVKGSILLFLLRLFGVVKWVRTFCLALLAATVVLYGAYLIALLCLCIPARGDPWDTVLLARCSKTTPATLTIGVCAVVIDTIIFVMPFFIVAKLQIQPNQKKGLALVFFVGFLTVVSSIVGLVYRVIVSYTTSDPMWNGANVSITAYTEIFGTVIVSCGPSMYTFWSGTLVKSSLYTSLRSRLSLSKLQSQSTSVSAANGHSGSTQRFSAEDEAKTHQEEHVHPTKLFPTPTSTEQLVEAQPIPLQAIQKSTSITQQSDDLGQTGPQHDQRETTKHIIRDEW